MKYHIIFVVGFFLTIIPFIGIPTSWKMVIIGLIGAALMIVALVRYYSAYSQLESNQSHVDGGPEDSSEASSGDHEESLPQTTESKNEVYESSVQPSPYYTPADRPTRTPIKARAKKKIIEKTEDESEDDDFDDVSYTTKNRYEEEHAF